MKRIYPAVPESLDDAIWLADWIELCALAADDGDASAGDLERMLDIEGVSGSDDLLAQTFDEIDQRLIACGDAYPFEHEGTWIRRRGNVSNGRMAYIFCLVMSYHGWRALKDAVYNPWLLFEELSEFAAASYLGGNSVLFGTSSRGEASSTFGDRVNKLAGNLREGEGYRPFPGVSVQDGKLDVVAWRDFPDHRPSQIILLGQCAAGANWKGKLSELQPREGFWDNWMSEAPVSPLIRSFFIPHSIGDSNQWKAHARRGGIFFDRCRVSHCLEVSSHDSNKLFARVRQCLLEHWAYDPISSNS